MTAYDTRARASAGRVLAPIASGGKGQTVTLTSYGEDTFDPETETTIPGAPGVQEGSGVEEAYSAFTVGSGLVQAGDVKFLLSPLNTDGTAITVPVAGRDTLTKADGDWAIVKVDMLAPAGTAVMFTLQLRRG